VERVAARTRALRVGVVDREALGGDGIGEVDLRAAQERGAHLVHGNLDATEVGDDVTVERATKVSDSDVNRVEKGIKAGKTRQQVFPKLKPLSAEISRLGLTVRVKIIRQTDALPVRLVRDGDVVDVVDAAAVREVDLQRKFHWSPFELADKLSISRPRATALREHLGIDKDRDCLHVFEFGSQRHPRYSDNALTRMREAKPSPISTWMRSGRRTALADARRHAHRAPCLTAPMRRARRRLKPP